MKILELIKEIEILQSKLDSHTLLTEVLIVFIGVIIIQNYLHRRKDHKNNLQIFRTAGILIALVGIAVSSFVGEHLTERLEDKTEELDVVMETKEVTTTGKLVKNYLRQCDTFEGCLKLRIDNGVGTEVIEIHQKSLTELDTGKEHKVIYPKLLPKEYHSLGEIGAYKAYYNQVYIKQI